MCRKSTRRDHEPPIVNRLGCTLVPPKYRHRPNSPLITPLPIPSNPSFRSPRATHPKSSPLHEVQLPPPACVPFIIPGPPPPRLRSRASASTTIETPEVR